MILLNQKIKDNYIFFNHLLSNASINHPFRSILAAHSFEDTVCINNLDYGRIFSIFAKESFRNIHLSP